MHSRILAFTLLLMPFCTSAGLFDDVMNKAKSVAEETVNKTIDQTSFPADKQEPASPPTPAANSNANNSSAPTQGDKYIQIKDISTARRPATPASIGLVRLRYDQSWLDDKTLLQLTEGVIYCQQNIIKTIGHQHGCLGSRVYSGKASQFTVKVVPVFSPGEIDGKNRKFVAQANKTRLKPYLIELANHLPPTFSNTLTWRGEYDFDNQQLKISIRNLEPAQSYHLNRIPKHLKHLDVYQVPDRNFDGISGEYAQMQPYIPEGLSNGILALVFDRKLSEGSLSMPPAEAESLFKNQSGNTIGGIAVLEFTVDSTDDNAAIATLEQVRILSTGEKIDPENANPVMTIPASAFPKISAPAPVAKTTKAGKPEPTPKPVKEKSAPKPAADPYMRAKTGKPYGPDVVDLKLGMTFAQADKILSNHKEVLKIIEGDPPRPFTRARMYIFQPGDEFIGIYGLNTANGERIAVVKRTVYFHPKEAPSQTAIAASIEKKYGQPSYTDESNGLFNRSWYTDANGNPRKDEGAATRPCEKALGGSSNDVWLDNGKYYQWTMPWPDKKYMGVRSGISVANHKSLKTRDINDCGPAVKIYYSDNSGMLTGPELRIRLYDPAWIVADKFKLEAKDAKQGASGLDL